MPNEVPAIWRGLGPAGRRLRYAELARLGEWRPMILAGGRVRYYLAAVRDDADESTEGRRTITMAQDKQRERGEPADDGRTNSDAPEKTTETTTVEKTTETPASDED